MPLALAAGLLASSLLGKAVHYVRLDPAAQADTDRHIAAMLEPLGWRAIGRIELTLAGDYHTLLWQAPGCPEPIEIGGFASDGEAEGLITQRVTAGRTLFYVHSGRVFRKMPPFAFLWDKMAAVLGTMRIAGVHSSPYVAVIAPAACPLEEAFFRNL